MATELPNELTKQIDADLSSQLDAFQAEVNANSNLTQRIYNVVLDNMFEQITKKILESNEDYKQAADSLRKIGADIGIIKQVINKQIDKYIEDWLKRDNKHNIKHAKIDDCGWMHSVSVQLVPEVKLVRPLDEIAEALRENDFDYRIDSNEQLTVLIGVHGDEILCSIGYRYYRHNDTHKRLYITLGKSDANNPFVFETQALDQADQISDLNSVLRIIRPYFEQTE